MAHRGEGGGFPAGRRRRPPSPLRTASRPLSLLSLGLSLSLSLGLGGGGQGGGGVRLGPLRRASSLVDALGRVLCALPRNLKKEQIQRHKNNDASTSLFNIAVNGDHNIQGSWIERCLRASSCTNSGGIHCSTWHNLPKFLVCEIRKQAIIVSTLMKYSYCKKLARRCSHWLEKQSVRSEKCSSRTGDCSSVLLPRVFPLI